MYENERQRKFQFELEKVRSFFEAVLAMVIFLLAVLFVVVSLYNDDPNVKVVAFVLLLMILGLIVYATVSRLNRLDEIERKYIKSYWGELVMA
jgi:Na+/citrate or Na+/malate symporter